MALIGKKVSLYPLRVVGRKIPSRNDISASLAARTWTPIPEDKIGQVSFVSANASIPEEFEKPFEEVYTLDNHLLVGVLVEERKVDKKAIRARVRREVGRMIDQLKAMGRKVEAAQKREWQAEVHERVLAEELPKAPVVRKVHQMIVSPEHDMILLDTGSPKYVDSVIPEIRKSIFGCTGDDDDFLIINPFFKVYDEIADSNRISAFEFANDQNSPPEDRKEYMREFLTWVLIKCVDERDGGPYEVDESIKICFSKNAELDQAQMKARTDNIPVQTFGVRGVCEMGLVDKVSLYRKDRNIIGCARNTNEGDGFSFQLNSGGMVGGIEMPPMNKKEFFTLLDMLLDGLNMFVSDIATKHQQFCEIRSSSKDWSMEVTGMRRAVSEYADQHPEEHFTLPNS